MTHPIAFQKAVSSGRRLFLYLGTERGKSEQGQREPPRARSVHVVRRYAGLRPSMEPYGLKDSHVPHRRVAGRVCCTACQNQSRSRRGAYCRPDRLPVSG